MSKLNRKSRHDLNLQRTAGKIVAEALAEVIALVKPGVSTLELDQKAEAIIVKAGAIPTFKGYYGFPGTLCTSVNDEVVHGIPRAEAILKPGDIISLDCGATYKGLIADSARTVACGEVPEDITLLMERTYAGLMAAIEKMRAGLYLEDVSAAVEDVCSLYGYGLVKGYGGHGVGHALHEEPFVANHRTGERGPQLVSNVTLAIEPMFNLGVAEVYTDSDEWTVRTADHLPSAHFEHTVLITDGEPEILTAHPDTGT
jgi:methionyl aminopeptidase